MKPNPHRIVCDNCGYEDLEFRAYVTWDVTKQEWEVYEIDWDSDVYCRDCECEVEIEHKPLDTLEIVKYGLLREEDDEKTH